MGRPKGSKNKAKGDAETPASDDPAVEVKPTEKPAKKPRKKEQLRIEGTERPGRIEEIEEAARDYVLERDDRMAANIREKERKKKLFDIMDKHNLTTYPCDEAGYIVEITDPGERKLKVRKADDQADDEDDDD